MIQFSLRCADGHRFDSWFQSGAAYESLKAAGHLSCATCGSPDVEKAMMAPSVSAGDRTASDGTAARGTQPFTRSEAEIALSNLRKHVEANSDYVGPKFVSEARAMHLGEAPKRAIWGEAKPEEARALAQDGVPVAPLPFMPSRKTN